MSVSTPTPLRPVRVRVPASTSNLGSGFDTVGLALDRYLTASYEPGPGPLRVERAGTIAGLELEPARDPLVHAFATRLGAETGGLLRVESTIPVARGLGSSAAAVVAGLVLADATRGLGPRREEWLQAATALEGHPDNASPAIHGGLVAAVAGARTVAFRLPLDPRVGFAFAAPGVEVSTPEARAALPDRVAHGAATRSLGRLAALLQGFATGDPSLLALGFEDELHIPYRLPLIPGAAAAIEEARAAGAWAATISGSGSGLIAVCSPDTADRVAAAMADAFRREAGAEGVTAFAATPDLEGVRVEEVDAGTEEVATRAEEAGAGLEEVDA